MSTITGTVTVGVTLGYLGYTSPLTITATAAVLNSSGAAIYASGSYANAVVVNQGTVTGGVRYDGIELVDGGSVVNSGTITGYYGIEFRGSGSIVNTGTITGNKTGVALRAGGAVDNKAGMIEGRFGVLFYYGAGTVINSATIDGMSNGIDFPGTGVLFGGSPGAVGRVRNTGLIEGGTGVAANFDVVTVSNSGTIFATYGNGVSLGAGGDVDNTAGLIEGEAFPARGNGSGIEMLQGGTVTNAGTIIGAWDGVDLGGGSVGNTGFIQGTNDGVEANIGTAAVTNSGTIIGFYGVEPFSGGSVENSGLIEGSGAGVYIRRPGGVLTNSGTIEGTGPGFGVRLGAGTVIDSGTISGANGTAIYILGTGGNRLVLEHSYSLEGTVAVAGTGNTLELLGAAGAVTVDFDKAGEGFTNFGTVAFGGAYGNDEPLTITNIAVLPASVAGFTQLGDIVNLTQLHPVGSSATLNGSDQLVVSNAHQSVLLQLDPSEDYAGVVWQTGPDGAGGTDVSAQPCFLHGTMILTPVGEVAVEGLATGDLVTTESGEARPIKWVGRRSYTARFALGQKHILPVCIIAGALADDVPTRDLWLSPNHALYLEGVLIEARDLVNGASIVQPEAAEAIEYFHIELDSHDVLVANGAAAESYIDDDNRLLFHNAAEYWTLYPEEDAQVRYCVLRLAEGGAVERARVAIARRAGLPAAAEQPRRLRRRR